MACAAGAGLTAVYNAPFSAAVFTLETLILTWNRNLSSPSFLPVAWQHLSFA
ncbi:chloride channel protein [uncultured Megasphaera sp.]|uniref:chloride channel protein n=1 Tax=uncultured Megasphaera sp. TaxID=165188 RepID=UPI0025F237FB|nr:chloride channel protein [uncultured Megasphaera sp.]